MASQSVTYLALLLGGLYRTPRHRFKQLTPTLSQSGYIYTTVGFSQFQSRLCCDSVRVFGCVPGQFRDSLFCRAVCITGIQSSTAVTVP